MTMYSIMKKWQLIIVICLLVSISLNVSFFLRSKEKRINNNIIDSSEELFLQPHDHENGTLNCEEITVIPNDCENDMENVEETVNITTDDEDDVPKEDIVPENDNSTGDSDEPFGYHVLMTDIKPIPNGVLKKTAASLPNSLIIAPGKYSIFGYTYDLQEEGLYRFVHPFNQNQQRIVFGSAPQVILSSVSWIVSHGNYDDNKTNKELSQKAMGSKLFLTCGAISRWARFLLNNYNIDSRLAAGLTLDNWNSYNNGHTLLEVYEADNDRWVLYDLDNNVQIFQKETPLSLVDFVYCVGNGSYEIKYISDDIRVDISNFYDNGSNYSYAFIVERFSTNESQHQLYQRLMQVPMIFDNEDWYFFDDLNRTRIESYSKHYKYIDEAKFMEKFY